MSDETELEDSFVEPECGSTLLDAFSLINGPRNALYGPFAEDYTRVANIFGAFTDHQPVHMTPELALLFMVSMKLGRISYAITSGLAYSDPDCIKDSITDANGYLDGLWITLNTPYETEDTVEELEEEEDDE